MLNHGNSTKLAALIFFLAFISISSGQTNHRILYTVSYANGSFGTDVLFSKIDLDSKSIIYSTRVPMRGEIQFKTPIEFHRHGQSLFFITTINGLAAKNSEVLDSQFSEYSMIDDNGEILSHSIIPNIQLTDFGHTSDLTANIEYIDSAGYDMEGILDLSNLNHVEIRPIRRLTYDDSEYPTIAGFQYFKKIKKTNNRLYWCTMTNGIYLLSFDTNDNRLIDSLNINVSTPYFYLFGLSDNNSLIYVFYMNSNDLGGPPDLQKITVDPSYVKILNSNNFAWTDSIPIDYPPLDSGYVAGTNGPCSKLGPYFVYFDMVGEDYRYFSPAMLFIFDTRTNEASWLRVGWR